MAIFLHRFRKTQRRYHSSGVHRFMKKNGRRLQIHSIFVFCVAVSVMAFVATPKKIDRTCVPIGAETTENFGTVTNLPLPRFVSLKASEANVRRGPSRSHRIDWVFQRRNLPLEIIAESGHWRSVKDLDGAGGWVHYSLLSALRSVYFTEDYSEIHKEPTGDATPLAVAQIGTIAGLAECRETRCLVSAGYIEGWVAKSDLWGIRLDEICR